MDYELHRLLTQAILKWLQRMAPGREMNETDFENLRAIYRRVEIWSNVALLGGAIAGMVFGFYFGGFPNHVTIKSFFAIGVMFGGMVGAPVLLIYLLARKKGSAYWHGYWLYQEVKYKTSSRFMLKIYTVFIVVGLISTVVVLV